VKNAIILAVLACAIASASASVPSKVSFTARLVNDETGDVVTGAHRVKFELFDADTAGTSVWFEGRQFDIDDDGLLFAELGETKALDSLVFDGRALWLEISLDDKVMEPRIALDSVPYAIRAHAAADAEKVGGKSVSELQSRVTGACGAGNFITGVNADGTVNCAAGSTGTGDITDVLAGSGLAGGGTSGAVTLGLLQTCAANQILKWTGTAWTCQADAVGTGDITGVLAGPGLMGGGASGDVTISLLTTCGTGNVLKWNGSTWICAIDIDTDTNAGGDITSVTTSAASGLMGGAAAGDVALSLLTTCGTNQILKWNGASWACANDIDTDTNAGGDITDVLAGAGLLGGGATGAVSLDIGAGTGITVNANDVALNTTFTDGRYVNATGDTMTGALDMGNNRLTNRSCPAAYVKIGPGLCTEDADASGFTFTGCANRCRAAGAHMCSSAEFRAILSSGVTLSVTTLFDWMDDQSVDDSAFFVSATTPENPDGVRATTTSSFCRCCTNIE
jgi:hypothetical protein